MTSAGGPNRNEQSLIQRILSNLCHSLAINEESAFEAELRRFTTIMGDLEGAAQSNSKLAQDPGLEQGLIGLREFQSAGFRKLYRSEPSATMKELMQQTFNRAVKTQQYSVINDIINYSR